MQIVCELLLSQPYVFDYMLLPNVLTSSYYHKFWTVLSFVSTLLFFIVQRSPNNSVCRYPLNPALQQILLLIIWFTHNSEPKVLWWALFPYYTNIQLYIRWKFQIFFLSSHNKCLLLCLIELTMVAMTISVDNTSA